MKYELKYRCRACEFEFEEIWTDLPADVKKSEPKIKIHMCGINDKGYGSQAGIVDLISYREIKK